VGRRELCGESTSGKVATGSGGCRMRGWLLRLSKLAAKPLRESTPKLAKLWIPQGYTS
jgi:hypothetical protein